MATKIRLGSKDAALVFRSDGTLEALLPLTARGHEPPQNALAADALLWAYGDERIMAAIVAAIEAEPQLIKATGEDLRVSQCSLVPRGGIEPPTRGFSVPG